MKQKTATGLTKTGLPRTKINTRGKTLSQVRAIAGRRGGKRTLELHGVKHMKAAGADGALSTWSTYRLKPALLNNFAMVRRDDPEEKPIAFLNGSYFRRKEE